MEDLLKIFGLLLLSTSALSERGSFRPFNINFQQNDYKVKFEHADIVSYNKNYLEHAVFVSFKYNRTCTTVNISLTFKTDVGDDLEFIIQAYRFASNEYRLFPMRFQFNFCDAVSQNAFGFDNIQNCGNFTNCPLEKARNYYICNYMPDTSRFPPRIPNGRYMLEFQGLYHSIEIGVFQAFLEISRPFVGF